MVYPVQVGEARGIGEYIWGDQSLFGVFCIACLCELHPNCTRNNVNPNEPFSGSEGVKNPILHEFGSGDWRIQSRNDPKKTFMAGVFSPLRLV